jgi:hypothetical protein
MLTKNRVLGFIAFLALAATWKYVYVRFGDNAGDRFWGTGLLVTSIWFLFAKEIPISLGSQVITSLTGWRKAYVLVPAFALGLAVVLAPHELRCALHSRHRVCP